MLKVFIDGNRYEETGIIVKKSFLSMSHCFEISYSLNNKIPLKIGSQIEIKEENKKVLVGQIEEVYIKDNLLIVRGENSSAGKLNSFPEKPINLNKDLTLDEIIYQCIGIKPIVKTITEPFTKEELIIDDNCTTYSEYISKLASKRAVYIIEDENGNLVITRNNETDIIGSLGESNISESHFHFDANKLYQNIILYAQSNINSYIQDGTDIPIEKMEGIKIIVSDPLIKNRRNLYKNLCYGISEPKLQNLANFQVGLQRAEAMKYKIKYPFFLLNSKQVANIGKLVKINNSYDNIKGTFFIEELLMKAGVVKGYEEGDYTIMTVTYMNAYKLNFTLDNNINLGGFIDV